jgi:hypothetical protein
MGAINAISPEEQKLLDEVNALGRKLKESFLGGPALTDIEEDRLLSIEDELGLDGRYGNFIRLMRELEETQDEIRQHMAEETAKRKEKSERT